MLTLCILLVELRKNYLIISIGGENLEFSKIKYSVNKHDKYIYLEAKHSIIPNDKTLEDNAKFRNKTKMTIIITNIYH